MKPVRSKICAACGKNPAEGQAYVNGLRYCHGDNNESDTCYTRVVQSLANLPINKYFEGML